MSWLRFAIRSLWRDRRFSASAVVLLGVGLAAVTAISSVLYEVAFRPLPWPDASRIVTLAQVPKDDARPGGGFSLSIVEQWRAEGETLVAIASTRPQGLTLTGFGEAARVEALSVDPDFFRVLGLGPILGRGFDEDDRRAAVEDLVVLSDGLARRLFGSAREALDQSLVLDGVSHQVIGVTAPGFRYPDADVGLWKPLVAPRPSGPGQIQVVMLPTIARLKAGVTLKQAVDEGQRFHDQAPGHVGGEDTEVRASSLRDERLRGLRPALWALAGAVGLLLLIVCVNVASLLLARGAGRGRELAVRASLGASRPVLANQLLLESLLLAVTGGVLGLGLAALVLRLLRVLDPGDIPGLPEVGLSPAVVGFALIAALLAATLSGVLPALQAAAVPPALLLARGGPVSGGRSLTSRVRALLVVVEVALSLALLVGAGLLLRSFTRLVSTETGFDMQRVQTARISLPRTRYDDTTVRTFYQELEAAIVGLDGVASAALTTSLPMSGGRIMIGLPIDGVDPATVPGGFVGGDAQAVTPAYFQTLGIPLLSGRLLEERDQAGGAPVMVINDAFRRRFLGEREALGLSTRMGEIVGVVADVRARGFDQEPNPAFFLPLAQAPPTLARAFGSMGIVARAKDRRDLIPALRASLSAIDPGVPLESPRTLEQLVGESVATPRFYAVVLGAFSLVALVLAALGCYATISFGVRQSTRENGIRVALGARRTQIVGRHLVQGVVLSGVGVLVGLALAAGLARGLGSLLFEISVFDLPAFAATSVLLLGVTLVASWLPSRRAAAVDPVVALRLE